MLPSPPSRARCGSPERGTCIQQADRLRRYCRRHSPYEIRRRVRVSPIHQCFFHVDDKRLRRRVGRIKCSVAAHAGYRGIQCSLFPIDGVTGRLYVYSSAALSPLALLLSSAIRVITARAGLIAVESFCTIAAASRICIRRVSCLMRAGSGKTKYKKNRYAIRTPLSLFPRPFTPDTIKDNPPLRPFRSFLPGPSCRAKKEMKKKRRSWRIKNPMQTCQLRQIGIFPIENTGVCSRSHTLKTRCSPGWTPRKATKPHAVPQRFFAIIALPVLTCLSGPDCCDDVLAFDTCRRGRASKSSITHTSWGEGIKTYRRGKVQAADGFLDVVLQRADHDEHERLAVAAETAL